MARSIMTSPTSWFIRDGQMVKRSDLPMVSCWMDLSLTEECEEAGDGGGLDGNGGFDHHWLIIGGFAHHHQLIIVPEMVSDCRDGFDRLVENCAERSDHQ